MIFVFVQLNTLSMIISKFIHVSANDIISLFIWLSNNTPLCVNTHTHTHTHTHTIFFIHSSIKGHLGCFHVLAIVNSAAMNIGCMIFELRVFSRYMPRSGLAGSYDNSVFSVLWNLHTALILVAPIYIPTNSVGGFPFLYSFSRIYFYRLF